MMELHEGQQIVKDQVFAGRQDLIFAVTGRRWGQTTLASQVSGDALLVGKSVVYVMLTRFGLEESWSVLRERLGLMVAKGLVVFDRDTFTVRPGPRSQHLSDVTIRLTCVRPHEVLLDSWPDLVILDGFQDLSDRLYPDTIKPMCEEHGGRVLFLMTPPALPDPDLVTDGVDRSNRQHSRDLLFELLGWDKDGRIKSPPAPPHPDLVMFQYPSFRNPHLDGSAIHSLRGQMSEDVYRREVEAVL